MLLPHGQLQYRSKGLQHYSRVKRMYYTHITHSAHAPYTHHTCKYTKMCVITRMQSHTVRGGIACKITRSRPTGVHQVHVTRTKYTSVCNKNKTFRTGLYCDTPVFCLPVPGGQTFPIESTSFQFTALQYKYFSIVVSTSSACDWQAC